MKAHILGLVISALAGIAAAHPTYRLTILNPLEGYETCTVDAINDSGLIVGNSHRWVDGREVSLATLWQDGKAISLGTLGGDWSRATGINRHGQVVGYSTLPPGYEDAWHSFWYRDGKDHLRDLTPYQMTTAASINDWGVAVGGLYDRDGNYVDVMVASRGVVTRLGVGPTGVVAINNDGAILLRDCNEWCEARLFKQGASYWLFFGLPFGLNNLGAVTGYATVDNLSRAVLYADGKLQVLEMPLRYNLCHGHALNDQNEVVGHCNSRPIMWRNGKSFDLLDLVVDGGNAGLDSGEAKGVNRKGQIVGNGQRGDMYVGFLLTPTRVATHPGDAASVPTSSGQ